MNLLKTITAVAAMAAVAALVTLLVGLYGQWRDCSEAGGKTVRGLVGLECIK